MKAWLRAMEIAKLLPAGVPWSFNITDLADDAVFNIYAPREVWHKLRLVLSVTQPEFRNDDLTGVNPSWEEYTIDGLTLSIITPEEHDGRDESEPDDGAARDASGW